MNYRLDFLDFSYQKMGAVEFDANDNEAALLIAAEMFASAKERKAILYNKNVLVAQFPLTPISMDKI